MSRLRMPNIRAVSRSRERFASSPQWVRRLARVAATATADLERSPPILVYQMGKVGSSTVMATLRDAGIEAPLYHVHFLTMRNLARELWGYARAGLLWSERANHVFTGLGLALWLRLPGPARWTVITGVRDPIARAVSDVFQTAAYRHPELCVGGLPEPDRVVAFLRRRITRGDPLLESTYRWLDDELAVALGVDVYSHRFDRNLGYSILEEGDVRLLVYRTEDIADRLLEALGRLSGFEAPSHLVSRNVSADKEYGDRYERVKRRFRLPRDRLEELYDHRYMEHFYGADGTARLVRRWSGGHVRGAGTRAE